jgi:hypothetical protein
MSLLAGLIRVVLDGLGESNRIKVRVSFHVGLVGIRVLLEVLNERRDLFRLSVNVVNLSSSLVSLSEMNNGGERLVVHETHIVLFHVVRSELQTLNFLEDFSKLFVLGFEHFTERFPIDHVVNDGLHLFVGREVSVIISDDSLVSHAVYITISRGLGLSDRSNIMTNPLLSGLN